MEQVKNSGILKWAIMSFENQNKIFTLDYFLDHIQRIIKSDISFYYYANHEERRPTKEEYEKMWGQILSEIKLDITDSDLGVYHD